MKCVLITVGHLTLLLWLPVLIYIVSSYPHRQKLGPGAVEQAQSISRLDDSFSVALGFVLNCGYM